MKTVTFQQIVECTDDTSEIIPNTTGKYTERVLKDYTPNIIKRIKENQDRLLAQIKDIEVNNKIHENQQSAAKQLVENFKNTKISLQLAIGLTQSGKTGSMLSFLKEYISSDNIIDPDNIFIITGLSSREWIEQIRDRMPPMLEPNIAHNNTADKLFRKLVNKTNIIIIIDEVHMAAGMNNTIAKGFVKSGIFSKLYSNDIKIVEFSATPNGILINLNTWNTNAAKVFIKPGDGYTGCKELLDMGKIFQYRRLMGSIEDIDNLEKRKRERDCTDDTNKIDELNCKIIEINKKIREGAEHLIEYKNRILKTYGKTYYYHIVRAPIKEYDELKKVMGSIFDEKFTLVEYNESSNYDINKILSKQPLLKYGHVIILIKDKLRCSKTLIQKYLGSVYERHTIEVDDSVVVQGLIGRITGYKYNGKTFCYTNIKSVKNYIQQWETEFKDEKTILKISSKRKTITHNHVNNFTDIRLEKETERKDKMIKYLNAKKLGMKEFDKYEDMLIFHKNIAFKIHGKNIVNKDPFNTRNSINEITDLDEIGLKIYSIPIDLSRHFVLNKDGVKSHVLVYKTEKDPVKISDKEKNITDDEFDELVKKTSDMKI